MANKSVDPLIQVTSTGAPAYPVTHAPSRTRIYAEYAKRVNAQRSEFERHARARELRTAPENKE